MVDEIPIYRFDNGYYWARVIKKRGLESLEEWFGSFMEISSYHPRGMQDIVFLVLRDMDNIPQSMLWIDRERAPNKEPRGLFYIKKSALIPTNFPGMGLREDIEERADIAQRAILTLAFDWLMLSPDATNAMVTGAPGTTGKPRFNLDIGYVIPYLEDLPPPFDDMELFDEAHPPGPLLIHQIRIFVDSFIAVLNKGMGDLYWKKRMKLLGRETPPYSYYTSRFQDPHRIMWDWRCTGEGRIDIETDVRIDPGTKGLSWLVSFPGRYKISRGNTLLEAFRSSGMLRTNDEWQDFLDTKMLPGQPLFEGDAEVYALVGEAYPVLWPLHRFIKWARPQV